MGYVIAIILGLMVVGAFFLPQGRSLWLNLRAEEIQVSAPAAGGSAAGEETLDLKIITVLGKDGIPAILEPDMISVDQAASQMSPSERVLGVSVDGDHRAYPLNMLSRHEIVNDVVGGRPLMVSW